MSQHISGSRSRLLRLKGGVVTKLRFLDFRDQDFESVEIFSTVETNLFPESLDRDHIETNQDPHA
jgi:hypothetical protein